LLTYPKGYQLKPWAWEIGSFVLAKYPELRAMVKEAPILQNLAMRKIEKNKKFLVIRPKETLPGHWLEREEKNIIKNVKLGNVAARDFLEVTKIW
jgi:predicted patatin/cPLA2 family phospholipase